MQNYSFVVVLFLTLILSLNGFQKTEGFKAKPCKISFKMALDVSELPGQLPPTGLFDPLGLSSTTSPRFIKRWRESELKHGRISMLAAIGIPVAESFHPLFKSVDGPAIFHFQEIENLSKPFWYFGLFAIGIIEGLSILKGWELPGRVPEGQTALLRDGYICGDLGFDPLGLAPPGSTNENSMSQEFIEVRNKELQNGRLAMLAVAGMVAQELVDHRTILGHYAEFGLRAASRAI